MRVLAGIAAATLLVIQVMTEIGTYEDPTWLPVTLAFIVGAVTVFDSGRAAYRNATLGEREGKRARIQKSTFGALSSIAKEIGLDLEVMGGSVFAAKRRWLIRDKWPRRDLGLIRVERFRLNDIPQPSAVRWTSGKGAIGAVLKNKKYEYVHWAPIAKRHGHPTITRAKFDNLPTRTKAGFTYEEFVGIACKYAEVLAVPIMSETGDKILGVLSIDRPYEEGDLQKRLDNVQVRGIAEAAAATVREDLH